MTIFLTGRQQAEIPQAEIIEVSKSDVVFFDSDGNEVTRFDLDQVVKVRWRQQRQDGRDVFVNLEVLGS